MRNNPPTEKTRLRDERKQVEEESSLAGRLAENEDADILEEYEEDGETVYEDTAISQAWGFNSESRRGEPANRNIGEDPDSDY